MSRFKTYYTPAVDLMYPRLSVTEKWDNAQRKFSICDQTDQGAFWACSFVLSDADRAAMWEVGAAHYRALTQELNLPPIRQGASLFRSEQQHKDPEGNLLQGQWIYKAARKTTNAQGHASTRPIVLNGMNQPIDRVDFWSGSKGRLCVTMLPTVDPKGITGGIRLFLDKVQLLEPIYGGGFDEVPNAASNTMAAPTPEPMPAPAPNPSARPMAPAPVPGLNSKTLEPAAPPFNFQAPATPPANPMPPAQGVPSDVMPNDIEDEIPF